MIQHPSLVDVQLAQSIGNPSVQWHLENRVMIGHIPVASSLSTPEKDEHLCRMHHENVQLKSQIARLREKIDVAINENSISVGTEFDEDMRDMVTN